MTHALWLLRLAIPLLLAAPTMAAEVRPPALAPEPGPALIGSEGVPLRITGRVKELFKTGKGKNGGRYAQRVSLRSTLHSSPLISF